jgi:outer membrane protein assembly factor BamE (lipoprotein component of BamABCDE complex)
MPARTPFRAKAVIVLCALLAGCATSRPFSSGDNVPGSGEIASVQSATNAIVPGKSTKADVLAALGKGVVVDFDSGYEVWVYREKPQQRARRDEPGTEFVVLFAPSGIVSKTRIRHPARAGA